MKPLEFKKVSLAYRNDNGCCNGKILSSFSTKFEKAKCHILVGPSGVGKTTLLRIASGLILPNDGVVIFGDSHSTPKLETISSDSTLVFQDYNASLFPWFTVRETLNWVRPKNRPVEEHRKILAKLISDMYLTDKRYDSYPWQLSGGQAQRVAVARALCLQPSLLLLDEPFASLDPQARYALENLLLREIGDSGKMTVLMATHDIDEATYLGEKIWVFGGRPMRIIEVIDNSMELNKRDDEYRDSSEYVSIRKKVREAQQKARETLPKGD